MNKQKISWKDRYNNVIPSKLDIGMKFLLNPVSDKSDWDLEDVEQLYNITHVLKSFRPPLLPNDSEIILCKAVDRLNEWWITEEFLRKHFLFTIGD